MERVPKLNLPLGFLLALFQLLLHVGNTMRDGRKLATDDPNPGKLSNVIISVKLCPRSHMS